MTARPAVPLARRVDDIDETMIRTMYDLAEQQSGDLVRLEIGEPDFDTPEHIVEAAAAAARDGATHYTHNAGLPALRAAIAEKMERDHDLSIEPSQVIAAAGATEALYLTLLTTAERGDEVVLPTPAWPQYRLQIQLAGATPVEVALSAADDFDLDVDRVVDAIGDDTACVVLNSPSNPTSQVYDPEAVEAVVEAAAEHDAVSRPTSTRTTSSSSTPARSSTR
ncbi:pyridoxal phosphate-dependent aminotransferase [Haloprofundus halobius]|uniref:pyridoxal phosphate-dependent aminotransferase n=1 Tax=Haloprofundus halobius TaxID=2876194 RepID=UPI00295EA78E|nr:aminotransferase class I/II-fold pyridoxal phosphate-dependent enzyme [Haloprofundus halobius]